MAEGLAHEDDLGPSPALGFDEDRIHVHGRLYAGRIGLDSLSPSYLASVGGYRGVQGHVLGLERGDAKAVLAKNPAEGGDQDALAHVGRGALDHQDPGGHAPLLKWEVSFSSSSAAISSPTSRMVREHESILKRHVISRRSPIKDAMRALNAAP